MLLSLLSSRYLCIFFIVTDSYSVYTIVFFLAENLSVQLNPGEDLFMDLPTPERVEVIYDDCVIYPNDPKIKQLCKSEHTHRLSHILKLGNVKVTDRGVYIIRDKEFKEELLRYRVHMKGASISVCMVLKVNINIIALLIRYH